MRRILFVCYGNICRSPMAEFIMKDLITKRGLEKEFLVASRGTSTEELGNPVYPPVKAELYKHGVNCADKTAEQLTEADYQHCDLLIVMDSMNLRSVRRMTGGDPQDKIRTMTAHTGGGDVDDPWYTRRFDIAYRDIRRGCEAWLEELAPE